VTLSTVGQQTPDGLVRIAGVVAKTAPVLYRDLLLALSKPNPRASTSGTDDVSVVFKFFLVLVGLDSTCSFLSGLFSSMFLRFLPSPAAVSPVCVVIPACNLSLIILLLTTFWHGFQAPVLIPTLRQKGLAFSLPHLLPSPQSYCKKCTRIFLQVCLRISSSLETPAMVTWSDTNRFFL
jgi:hypothetical protein